jgi:hypothetical protein
MKPTFNTTVGVSGDASGKKAKSYIDEGMAKAATNGQWSKETSAPKGPGVDKSMLKPSTAVEVCGQDKGK